MKKALIASTLVLIIVLSLAFFFFLSYRINKRKSDPASPEKRLSPSVESSDKRNSPPEKPSAERAPSVTEPTGNANAKKDDSDPDDVEDNVEPESKSLPPPLKNAAPPPKPTEKELNFDEYRNESTKIMHRLKECRERLARQTFLNDGILPIKNELERINAIMNDKRYICFDRCIHLEGIVFHRVMRKHKVMPSQHGYYHTINWRLSHKERRKWNHVPVTYTCLDHDITWTEAEANDYRQNHYVPLSVLEIKKKTLEKSLARTKRELLNPNEVNKLEQEIAVLRAQLSFLRRKYGIPDVDAAEKRPGSGKNQMGASEFAVELSGDIRLEMVKVEAGSFLMSAPDGSNRRNERPHHATLMRDFYIGKTEVTQAQWRAVTGRCPSYFKGNDQLPMEKVSWNDAMEFCEKLNTMGKAPRNWRFTLPTETQWEYAARGGRKSLRRKYSGSDNLDEVAWHKDNSGGRTHPVAGMKPNELGLYDMTGNVWEWCLDDYNGDNSRAVPEFARGNDNNNSRRVIRGGCWNGDSLFCRSAIRSNVKSDYRLSSVGFRLALVRDGSDRQGMRGPDAPENDPQNPNGQESDPPRRVKTDRMSKHKFVMKQSETRYFPKKYSPPYTIRAMCRTDGVALRFLLMGGEIQFKWDNGYGIIVRLPGAHKPVRFGGENGWSNVEIRVTATELFILVDDVLRYSQKGDFSNKQSRIGVRTLRVGDPKSTVSIKQLTISY